MFEILFGLLIICCSSIAEAESKTLSTKIPSLEMVENYPQTMEKGGIRITVEPYEFKLEQAIKKEMSQHRGVLQVLQPSRPY